MGASYSVEELQVGQSASIAKTITEADILMFAAVSTDINPAHLNEEYAKTTMFGGRIAHGMLTAGLVSAVLGNELPGYGTIYLGQTLKFKAPVRPGETVTATATVKEINAAKNRVIIETVCTVAGKVVLEGEATVMPPKKDAA
jgi:3-hydroxybutyryl-CoA dehydratase